MRGGGLALVTVVAMLAGCGGDSESPDRPALAPEGDVAGTDASGRPAAGGATTERGGAKDKRERGGDGTARSGTGGGSEDAGGTGDAGEGSGGTRSRGKGSPERERRSGGRGDSGGRGGGGDAAPGRAAVPDPIPAGTYRYRTRGTQTVAGASQPYPSTTKLVAESPSGGRQAYTRDLRDSDGNGSALELVRERSESGVGLSAMTITAKQGPLRTAHSLSASGSSLIIPAGAGPGDSRTVEMSGRGVRASIRLEVVRLDTVSVAGRSVPAVLIRTATRFSGDLRGTSDSEAWVSRSTGLTLREEVATDVVQRSPVGDIRVRGRYDADLISLDP